MGSRTTFHAFHPGFNNSENYAGVEVSENASFLSGFPNSVWNFYNGQKLEKRGTAMDKRSTELEADQL